MTAANGLFPASYKGVFFYCSSFSATGGRKTVKHEFVKSPKQFIEDMGPRPRTYTLEAVVADQSGRDGLEIQTYFQHKNELLSVLDRPGPGLLIHPTEGRVENMVVTDYSVAETLTTVGMGTISITFDLSDSKGKLTTAPVSIALLRNKVQAFAGASSQDIGSRILLGIRTKADAVQDLINKGTDFVNNTVKPATEPINKLATRTDSFARSINTFSTSIASLVSNPTNLGLAISDVIYGVANLFDNTKTIYQAVLDLFPFGALDVPFEFDTYLDRQLQGNRDVFNVNVQGQALAYAYQAACEQDYLSTDEIDAAKAQLQVCMDQVEDNGLLTDDMLDQLMDIKITANQLLDIKRQNSYNVVSYVTPMTSASLLAYAHYGSSDLSDEVMSLNGLTESTFIEGEILLFSEV